jgi:hypothetical protein
MTRRGVAVMWMLWRGLAGIRVVARGGTAVPCPYGRRLNGGMIGV